MCYTTSVVWRNSHWSVALSLTVVMAGVEILTYTQLMIIKELKRLDSEVHEEVG